MELKYLPLEKEPLISMVSERTLNSVMFYSCDVKMMYVTIKQQKFN